MGQPSLFVAGTGKGSESEAVKDEERAEGRSEETAQPQTSTEEAHEGKEEQPSRFLERGLIYFFYRPKVGVEEVHDIDDVRQRLSLIC